MHSRKGLAALILGANMPDIDIFFGAAPWAPLAIHRGFTHGLVGGVLLMPPMLAGCCGCSTAGRPAAAAASRAACRCASAGWSRWPTSARSATAARPADDLFGAIAVALLGRLVPRRRAVHHRFVAVAALGAGHRPFALARKTRSRVASAAAGRDRHRARLHRAQLAITQQAVGAVRGWAGERRPRPSSPRRRRSGRGAATSCGARAIAIATVASSGDWPRSRLSAGQFDDPLVREAIRRDPRLRRFLRWSILPIAEIERGRCSARVTIGDARYGEPAARAAVRQAIVPIGCQAPRPSQ